MLELLAEMEHKDVQVEQRCVHCKVLQYEKILILLYDLLTAGEGNNALEEYVVPVHREAEGYWQGLGARSPSSCAMAKPLSRLLIKA